MCHIIVATIHSKGRQTGIQSTKLIIVMLVFSSLQMYLFSTMQNQFLNKRYQSLRRRPKINSNEVNSEQNQKSGPFKHRTILAELSLYLTAFIGPIIEQYEVQMALDGCAHTNKSFSVCQARSEV